VAANAVTRAMTRRRTHGRECDGEGARARGVAAKLMWRHGGDGEGTGKMEKMWGRWRGHRGDGEGANLEAIAQTKREMARV